VETVNGPGDHKLARRVLVEGAGPLMAEAAAGLDLMTWHDAHGLVDAS